jgi:hypothetical protein
MTGDEPTFQSAILEDVRTTLQNHLLLATCKVPPPELDELAVMLTQALNRKALLATPAHPGSTAGR